MEGRSLIFGEVAEVAAEIKGGWAEMKRDGRGWREAERGGACLRQPRADPDLPPVLEQQLDEVEPVVVEQDHELVLA